MSESNLHFSNKEVLDADDAKIAAMLGDLKIVDAPKDFEGALRKRLAHERPPVSERPALFPVLRYAFPLAIVLLAGGAYMLNDSYTLRSADVPVVNESPATVNSPAGPGESETIAETRDEPKAGQQEFPRIEKQFAANPRKPAASKASIPRRPSKPAGGSVDKALVGPGKTIFPGGIESSATLGSREILSRIGVDAVIKGDVWSVRSVTKNSVGDRAGVKTGDTMLSIDGRALDDKARFTAPAGVKKIGVRRDGKIIDLPLPVQK